MGIIHLPNINVQDTLKRIRCICRISDIPRSAIVSIESVDSIIESVDSICRDSADTQYMLIQKNSQNLRNS